MVTVSPPDFWSYALRLPHDPRAPRVARMTVRAALSGHGMDELLDVTELLTSELVTNAYLHTKGPVSLRLRALGRGGLRVFVWDTDPYIPPPFGEPPNGSLSSAGSLGSVSRSARAEAVGGRGLLLVQQCADAWGGWPLGDDRLGKGAGKLLWFEVGRYAAMRQEQEVA